jgi:adenosylcobinamide-phosphate guanylyltransferase
MAGGKGERFTAGEKPLAKFGGRPLVEHVLRALDQSKSISGIIVVTSPWTRKTDASLKEKWKTINAPGKGYVEDMTYAIRTLGLGKTLVVAADLPLLKPEDIDHVVNKYREQKEPALAVMIPPKLYGKLGLTPTMVIDDLVPAGVNVVDGKNIDGPERILVLENPRLAFNVNTMEDLSMAELNRLMAE